MALHPVAALVDLVAPPRCAVCRRRVDPGLRLAWCPACGRDVQSLPAPCPRCAAPGAADAADGAACGAGVGGVGEVADGRADEAPGGACPLDGTAVAATVAAHGWAGTVGAVVRAGKLDGCHGVFGLLGDRVADAVLAGGGPWPRLDVVCPVPASPRRRRRRGFDHADLLARSAAAGLGLPSARLLALRRDVADRGAGMQVPAAHDVRGLATAMVGRRPVRGHVLLVDDVVTTGTTVAAAALALRTAGATRVSVAAVARAGRH